MPVVLLLTVSDLALADIRLPISDEGPSLLSAAVEWFLDIRLSLPVVWLGYSRFVVCTDLVGKYMPRRLRALITSCGQEGCVGLGPTAI